MNTALPSPGCTAALVGLLALLAGTVLAAPAMPFTLVVGTPRTLSPAALASAQKTATHGQAAADKKMITFASKTVRLVAVTGPDDDMLSYRMDGLRNPTLVVPRSATIRVLFANTDDDMFHDLRFGAALQTYPNEMQSFLKSSVGSPPLPHKSETALHAEEMTIRAPTMPGVYVYYCTVRGHAQGGMVGRIVVR